ncbi:unnamed protein product [Hermetia illucens]|uniref:Adenylate cyclase type 9 n=2 Tax=Hermetia illucens TaxID=343691 RepID=A0A7R8V2W9_HERIL|nr:adenylate cyclase type 9 isoform X2 [Hermetia illucens]CAD7091177.1 unnamed protein product [Hermetia illucens]
MPPGVLVNESRNNSTDDIQIALAPHIQLYLSQTGRRHSCCSVMLPVAFERAAAKSWLDPRFDSVVLEEQYQQSIFAQIRMRFRFALFYILLYSVAWFIYFITKGTSSEYWQPVALSLGFLFIAIVTTICVTKTTFYKSHTCPISACVALTLCAGSLILLGLTDNAVSPLGHFSFCLEIILLIYTALPMRVWLAAGIAINYSILFELLTHVVGNSAIHGSNTGFSYKILILRIFLQITVHLVGLHVLIMNIVRMRGTFMKVGQNLLVRRQLEMEKQLKEKMIHSVMPPKVADMLLKEGGGVDPEMANSESLTSNHLKPRPSNDVKSLFRPFHMHSMSNVSILFADIVGFTKMSSTKTAEQLVEILNDLFERFDDLCVMNGCEKISTLGDCYYCVSGCPEPRPDHAICCVEMGLGMIAAMRAFDMQRHEGVKMRVGVHTGTVLCGIVGTRRVKFDVWSNDVTLANKMESTGRPEQVHISEETCSFLGDAYFLEEGEEVFGHRTCFVTGRRKDLSTSRNSSLSPLPLHLVVSPPDSFINGVSLSQSATNISAIQPTVPPASPVGPVSTSLNPSPVLSIRPRIASLSMKIRKKSTNCLMDVEKVNTTAAKPMVREHPKIIVTTKSLPGSLDSDHEDEGCCRGSGGNGSTSNTNNKTGSEEESMTAKYTAKIKNWKVPKFLKKIEELKKSDPVSKTKPTDEIQTVDQNGYQQLPVVIETPRPSFHTLDIPNRTPLPNPNMNPSSGPSKSPEGSCCSPGQHSMFDDIIDIRSYISQSRSDISPFGRSGSYRSQCGRSAANSDSPVGRPRSSTTVITKSDQQRANVNNAPADCLSICPSATSRKDSGIKSNSRRSSIQQQIYALNQSTISQHRVSGYFTSSQSSLSNMPDAQLPPVPNNINSQNQNISDTLAACLQQLRKQSDLQLIRCVRDNAKSQRSYLVKPPLRRFSLFFKSRQMEKEFRSKAHRFGNENESEGPPTLATPRYNTYIDIFVGIMVYLAISGSLFLMTPTTVTPEFRFWVLTFVIFTAIQFFALFLFTRQMCRRHSMKSKTTVNGNSASCADRIFEAISSWYPWHICLAILMLLPVSLIIINFLLLDLNQIQAFEYHYGFLVFVCIVHFCNFTQLNCWMRNILAFLAGMCFVGIAVSQLTADAMRNDGLNDAEIVNGTNETSTTTFSFGTEAHSHYEDIQWFQDYHLEIYLDLFLLLILVWFLNREFEIGYRTTFYGSAVANQDKIRVQSMKNQADMLLHNIIPKHVAEQLKNTAKYSENHHDVAIIFASIVNFNEMYDESYLGGKEFLRVLNELIGDFDELLTRPEFRCVEKIKTIGSTFMAASGLDPESRGENNQHIYALMEFALAMQSVVDAFNKDLLEFNLILRIGFNIGDVTAGVIGTSKLHYDIWGDAVNVASRMDSTGVPGRIQVGSYCLSFLENKYTFEPRGQVYVKGKDHMEVFLLKERKIIIGGESTDGKWDGAVR